LTLRVSEGTTEILSFTPLPDETPAILSPATPALPPQDIASNEELFLNGLHLEQYRHATYAPEPYYAEALRRGPNDSRWIRRWGQTWSHSDSKDNSDGCRLFRLGCLAALPDPR
jgi:hypothetical protein